MPSSVVESPGKRRGRTPQGLLKSAFPQPMTQGPQLPENPQQQANISMAYNQVRHAAHAATLDQQLAETARACPNRTAHRGGARRENL